MSQTLEQKRAQFAWKCAKERKVLDDYGKLAKAAPALIMGNGLMASLAFWESRKKEHACAFVKDILGWLKERKITDSNEFLPAMNAIHKMKSSEYMQATNESLEFLKWLRQLAAAL